MLFCQQFLKYEFQNPAVENFIITKSIVYKLNNKFIIMLIHYVSITKTKGFKKLCES